MASIVRFPIDKTAQASSQQEGHRCFVFPFPQQFVATTKKSRKTKSAVAKVAKPKTRKSTLITKAKIAQKQLGIGDADYRILLQHNFGVNSCTELDGKGLIHLIEFYRSKGWQDQAPARATSRKKVQDRHGKPVCMRDAKNPATPFLERIEALLCEIGNCRGKYMPWDYAAGILKKQTGLDILDAATALELRNVMVALERTLHAAQRKQAYASR